MSKVESRVSPTRKRGNHLYDVTVHRRTTQEAQFQVVADSPEEAREKVLRALRADFWDPFLPWDRDNDDIYDDEYERLSIDGEAQSDLIYDDNLDTQEIMSMREPEPAPLNGTHEVVAGTIRWHADVQR